MPSADEPNKHQQAEQPLPEVVPAVDIKPLDDLPMAAELFDLEDPRSLVNLLPAQLSKVFQSPLVDKKMLYLSEREAERKLAPEPVVYKIRIAFWKVFEYARATHQAISLKKVAELCGQPEHYVRTILMHRPGAFTFVLVPPSSYETELEEALMFGMRRLREDILTLPIKRTRWNEETNMEEEVPIPENAKIVLQAIAFLDMRKHGGIVQKQLTVHNDISQGNKAEARASLAELDRKIKELEKELEEKAKQASIGVVDTRELTDVKVIGVDGKG